VADQNDPGDDPKADPPPIPPPPPIDWGQDPSRPPLPPWAAPPPYVTPEPAPPAEDPATPEQAGPWRIPPQPPWDPSTGSPPAVPDQPLSAGPGPAVQYEDRRLAYGAGTSDLPPSAAVPRSSPLPPDVPRPTVRFDEPWRREVPKRRRSRAALLGAGVAVAVALVAGGVVVLARGGEGERASPGPEARLAAGVFAPDPAAKADGRDQELLDVASAGSIVVAIGGEIDTVAYRPEFLVSTDGGRTFRLAGVRTADDAEPAYGDTPRAIAGSDGSWVAIGGSATGSAVWTSGDGKAWVRQPDAVAAAFGHDKVARVARTASGFVAVGDTSQKGDFSDAVPVVWLSPDGRRWERLGNDQLKMSLPGGPLSLIDVAASGGTVIAYGWTTNGKGTVVKDGVWRSTDGGRSWQPVDVPHPKGTAGPGIAIAATPTGFLAGRNATGKSERYGVVLAARDGQQWQAVGEIHLPGYGGLQRLVGSDRGLAAVIGGDRKILLARSTDGRTWQNAGEVPTPPGRTVRGVAVTAGATIVAARDAGDQDSNAVLAVRDTLGQEVPVDPAGIPGAMRSDQTVMSVASGNGVDAAVGSSNGDGAIWTSADGARWTRAQPVDQALAGSGKQRLTSVASGGAGWVATGFGPGGPLVVTSQDGATWRSAGDAFRARGNEHLATYAAAYGPAGFVIVGESGFSAAVWHSADRKTWDRGEGGDLEGAKDANRWMRGAVGGAFGYVAVGGLSDPAVTGAAHGRPAVWTSADGVKWALRQVPLPSGSVEGWFDRVVARGNTLVATGTATTASGRAVFAFVSSDGGRSWQEVRLPAAGSPGADSSDRNSVATAAAATSKGFVLAGAAGRPGRTDVVLWTSRDGRSWTGEAPRGRGLSGAGDQWLTGLAVHGNALLAVGVTADHRGEQPTLWRRPLP
jgi:hypothetical protein